MKVIGTGVGRTGTYSLKLAINELGLGPCHHMEAVVQNMDEQVPAWNRALAGEADWSALYNGYESAVDWPTARFYRELYHAFPDAKFILTTRDPQTWAQSFSATIYKLIAGRDQAPPPMQDWLEMCVETISSTGFPLGLGEDELAQRFSDHNEAVKELIPADQLLVFQVKEGWGPLCEFLGKPVPHGDFPRTNDREEFWDLVSQNS